MINGQLKSDIDKLWDDFWAGGIANPLSVIEQISFLMFARLLDIRETREEKKASRTGKPFRRIFSEKHLADEARRKALEGLVRTEQDLRWSHFRHLNGEDMLRVVRDGVFHHFKTVAMDGAKFGEYMKDAQLLIQKPQLIEAFGLPEDILEQPAAEVEKLVKNALPPMFLPDKDHIAAPGTSFASPIVAGIVADLREANPKLTPGDIKKVLMDTADNMGAQYGKYDQGKGWVDAKEAMEKVTGQQ